MTNKMLIDASHPEETRVVVTRGNRIEEFDFESESKKQLKGNIYLARVTRVEPSLQAAFVEYGGNRHGFLAFSEIHPDYYQIPVADRQAILAAEAEEAEADDEDEKPEPVKRKRRRGTRGRGKATSKAADSDLENADSEAAKAEPDELAALEADEPQADSGAAEEAAPKAEASEQSKGSDQVAGEAPAPDDEPDDNRGGPAMAATVHGDVISEDLATEEDRETADEKAEADSDEEEQAPVPKKRSRRTARTKRTKEKDNEPLDDNGDAGGENGDGVESVGAEDALEELPSRRRPVRRQYKIQEVIKRRQILLVQVVKEERGTKGAALTTYLSLAGRYSVLMPNTARGGGISRKITNVQDRKRLKDVVKELDVPQGMGVILRTAGANRTKAEIKRDYEYLMRLWMTIRNLTLESTAPALVHEEGSLIKRSVRDLYNKEIGEILVAGDEGYREAKGFMRMLMPSHAKAVQPYKENVPIFARNGIEAQLDKMLQPQVTMKSGGYVIINQTEALVAIDVNSGRSTREHSIEDTALQTNLEAAEEVARQLRLRDLAGLVVIDFIDMEEKRNNRAVEKRLKECLKHDRARIQVGRISHFGLLEMSRQRIRASVLESTMQPCEACHGTGHIRSDSSVALHVVRGIEEYLLKDSGHNIVVRTPAATALYVLNNKRSNLSELEERFGLTISIEADQTLGAQHFQIVKGAQSDQPVTITADQLVEAPDDAGSDVTEEQNDQGEEGGGKKKRRRRRRRSGRSSDSEAQPDTAGDTPAEPDNAGSSSDSDTEDGSSSGRKRRRGRRGGRKGRSNETVDETSASDTVDAEAAAANETDGEIVAETAPFESQPEAAEKTDETTDAAITETAPVKPKRSRRKKTEPADADGETVSSADVAGQTADNEAQAAIEEKPARRSRRKKAEPADSTPPPPVEPMVTSVVPESEAETPATEPQRKQGWWRRKSFF